MIGCKACIYFSLMNKRTKSGVKKGYNRPLNFMFHAELAYYLNEDDMKSKS
jgi:hypothetical protein